MDVEVQFQLTSDTHSSVPLTVPILVARDELEHPIIGYNIIGETIKDRTQVQGESDGAVIDIMNAAFRELTVERVNALVDFVQPPAEEYLCVLRTSKNNITVPQGQSVMVPCRVDCGPLERRTPVLFEPALDPSWPVDLEVSEQLLTLPRGSLHRVNIAVHNPTKHDVVLGRRTPLGNLQLIASVTPIEVVPKDLRSSVRNSLSSENESSPAHQTSESSVSPPDIGPSDDRIPLRTPAVALGDLTERHRQLATKMLTEEAESFAQDDDDVGCIQGLQMKLELSDTTPVQKTYTSIPRPLYAEVKHYLEDP